MHVCVRVDPSIPTFTLVALISESPHEVSTVVAPGHYTNVTVQLYTCVCVCVCVCVREREREDECGNFS